MARAPTKISPPKSLAVRFPRGLTTAPAVSYFSFFFVHRRQRARVRGERRNREERGRKLLPFTINLHNFTFSLAAHGSERKTTRSRSSGVRLACEGASLQATQSNALDTFLFNYSRPSVNRHFVIVPAQPPLPLLLSLPHTNTAFIFFSRLP